MERQDGAEVRAREVYGLQAILGRRERPSRRRSVTRRRRLARVQRRADIRAGHSAGLGDGRHVREAAVCGLRGGGAREQESEGRETHHD